MRFGDIDPVAALVALGTFIVAILAALWVSERIRRVIFTIAAVVVVGSVVMLVIATANHTGESTPDQPAAAAPEPISTPPNTTVQSPTASTPPPVSEVPAADVGDRPALQEAQPTRLTKVDVRATKDTNKVGPNTYKTDGQYDYRYTYTSRSTTGDLTSSDCEVTMRIIRESDGQIIGKQEQLSDCTLLGGYDQQSVPPGSYAAVVTVRYGNQTAEGRLPFRIIPG